VSDAELVGQVRRGDIEAFGRLIERYERTLLSVALAELHDVHAAEDVVQAAMLLAFRRLETLRDERKFAAWLIQIARRQVIDAVRARRVAITVRLDGSEENRASEGINNWAENEHLLNLIARLPERERVLIGLRFFDGHSIAEIATISARPVGTVTKTLSRAIARLRAWCDKENLR
jgi:RNA polymerase sigma-70 factor (ECF subfamily)